MSRTASSTLAITASLTGAERLMAAEAVEIATPARLATSLIVAIEPSCQTSPLMLLCETFRICNDRSGKGSERPPRAKHAPRTRNVSRGANAPPSAPREDINDQDFTALAHSLGRRTGRQRQLWPRLRAVGRDRDA